MKLMIILLTFSTTLITNNEKNDNDSYDDKSLVACSMIAEPNDQFKDLLSIESPEPNSLNAIMMEDWAWICAIDCFTQSCCVITVAPIIY